MVGGGGSCLKGCFKENSTKGFPCVTPFPVTNHSSGALPLEAHIIKFKARIYTHRTKALAFVRFEIIYPIQGSASPEFDW